MSAKVEHAEISGDIVALIPVLRGYAWSLTRSHQDVDDLVQETMTKAIANTHRFQAGTNLRAWLMTIMRNSFYNNISKSSRERTGSADCVSHDLISQPTQKWTIRCNEVMSAILLLPRHYREMLVLVVMLGEPYDSAAKICGVAIGTVKSRINRARAMVLQSVDEGQERSLGRSGRAANSVAQGVAGTERRRPRRAGGR